MCVCVCVLFHYFISEKAEAEDCGTVLVDGLGEARSGRVLEGLVES